MSLPAPPVPAKLREMLQDYPEHIERLQDVLNRSVKESQEIPLMPFDDAISALEGRLGSFISEARAELAAAEVSTDQQAIARATAKEKLMSFARSRNIGMAELDELWEYFQVNTRAF